MCVGGGGAGAGRGSTIMQRNANGNKLEWKTAANEGNDLHCFWHLHCVAREIGERIANWPNQTAMRMNEWTTRATRTANQQRREFASAADPSVALAVRIWDTGFSAWILDAGLTAICHRLRTENFCQETVKGGRGSTTAKWALKVCFMCPLTTTMRMNDDDDDDDDDGDNRMVGNSKVQLRSANCFAIWKHIFIVFTLTDRKSRPLLRGNRQLKMKLKQQQHAANVVERGGRGREVGGET